MNRAILFAFFVVVLLLIIVVLRLELIPKEELVQKTAPLFGIYEVCADIENCNPEAGIEKIASIGAKAVIVTVIDDEDQQAVSYYPSQYLPTLSYLPDNYLKRIIQSAQQKGIKVYASINLPHYYWLNKHPDWIAVFSNGKPADSYPADYFYRIVPPSRLISEPECQELMANIIKEVAAYGFDGIDINDNFQFSDYYIEETDTTLFSSFDDFTIEKFETENNLIVQGNSAKEKAEFLLNEPLWFSWRAEQVTALLKIFKQAAGPTIAFRPHLLTHEDPYQYYGLDYPAIAPEVDVLFLMIMSDQPKEKHFEMIASGQEAQAKSIAVSTYLFETKQAELLERMQWIEQAGADEIYLYNFALIDQANLWQTLKDILSNLDS